MSFQIKNTPDRQGAIAQLALPPPIMMGRRVRPCNQDLLGACIPYQ